MSDTPSKDPQTAPRKRGRGRPRHEPTEAIRNAVRTLALGGVPHVHILRLLTRAPGCEGVTMDMNTLYRYYRWELDYGLASQVAEGCGQLMAAVRRGEAWAICKLLASRAPEEYGADRGTRKGNNDAEDAAPMTQAQIAATAQPVQLSQHVDADTAIREYLSFMNPKARPEGLPQLTGPGTKQ